MIVSLSYEGARIQAVGIASRVKPNAGRCSVRHSWLDSSCSFGRNMHCDNDG